MNKTYIMTEMSANHCDDIVSTKKNLKKAFLLSYLTNAAAYIKENNLPSQSMFYKVGFRKNGSTTINNEIYQIWQID